MSTALVYVDANEVFRIFERERGAVLERLQDAVTSSRIALATSDVLLLEVLKGLGDGARRGRTSRALRGISGASDCWLHLNSLRDDELRAAFAAWRERRPFAPIQACLPWRECARRLFADRRFADAIQPEDLPGQYRKSPKSVLADFEAHWRKGVAPAVRQLAAGARSHREATEVVFKRLTNEDAMAARGASASEAETFAAELWADGEACPHWRISIFEVTFTLWDPNRDIKMNSYLDIGHAGARPYVDFLVSQDRYLRQVIQRFDSEVRSPRGFPTLGPGVLARIEEVPGF